jgi:TNF receptor-associated factor 4
MNLQQRHLHEHLENDCPKRLVKCLFCEEEGTYQFTTGGHLEICLVYPIGCTNAGCNQQIPRQLMSSHKEACPKEIIPCQYETVGCKEKIIREEQDEHNEKWVKQHLQLAVEEVKSTKQKLEPLQHQLKKLEANNKKFASKLVEMKNSHEIQLTDAQLRIKKLEQSHVEMVQKQNKKSFLWRLNKFDETPNWYSPGLYTSPGGYKMCLRVAANNLDEYLSCYIYLMSGKHDDLLTWPFSGQVTIELLNQLEDNNHHSETFNFNDSTPEDIKSRVIDQQRSPDGWGIRKFLRLTELNFNPSLNCQYLKDNVLCFRVSVVVTSKPWLIPSN